MAGAAEISGLLQLLDAADRDATLALNALHSPVSDAVWLFFSARGIWFVMYAVILFFMFRNLGWRRALIVFASCVLFVLACDQFANLVKHSVCRLRPMEDADMLSRGLHVLQDHGGLYGFFSAHAANAMGFAVCSAVGFGCDRSRNYRPYKICIILWALLVGVSRVFVGKHYLGDVLAGFAVGLLLGLLFGWLGRLCIRSFGKRNTNQ